MNTTPPGIIFDLDGTLANTLDDLTSSLNQCLLKAGVRSTPWSATEVRDMVGDGLATLIQRAADEHDDRSLIRSLIDRFRDIYARHYLDATQLYQGWEMVLDQLRDERWPLAVLSNKPHDFTRKMCAALLADWPLVHVEGQQPGVPCKPDSTRALAICRLLDRAPGQALFIGDSDNDIRAGRGAGMLTVGVTWGFRDRAVLEAQEPDWLIDQPTELLRLLPQLRAAAAR